MSLLYWRLPAGQSGRMNVAANWDVPGGTRHAPVAGDTARMSGNGMMTVAGEGTGVHLWLVGRNAPGTTQVNLVGGSIDSISVNAAQYSYGQSASATVHTTGRMTATGGIGLGVAHGAPDTLNLALGSYATFVNKGNVSVLNGSALIEYGRAHSAFENDGTITTAGGASLKFGTDVTGIGTISDNLAATGGGSKIEFFEGVGAGQTISLNAGTLQLDKPMQFHATIAALNANAAAADGPTSGLGNGAIVLEHTRFDMVSLSTTELVLTDHGHKVADLHFSGLEKNGSASLYVTRETDGSTVVSGYALPGAMEAHVNTITPWMS